MTTTEPTLPPSPVHAFLRALADADPPADDAALLAHHRAGDERAFAALVRRHGRLVWTACRHLSRSEAAAEDAFQATFLVLLRNARTVRDPAKLSAWLHGVAYKVCGRARQAEARRAAREKAAATREGNGHAVPQAAWDRTLAAVHQEVAGLPESLRVPFVLCCLEGVGPTEAARHLGWKIGTLSARLTRAKDAVLARLDARGLSLGAVAGLGLVAPPSSAVARAVALAHVGSIIPASLLTLSHGVVGMSVNPFKALAAATLVACGVGGSVGSGFLATAQAQRPGAAAKTDALADEVKALRDKLAATEAALAQAKAQAGQTAVIGTIKANDSFGIAIEMSPLLTVQSATEAAVRTAKFDYQFVRITAATQAKFGELLKEHEGRGWEYAGTTPLADPQRDVWVFRRPVSTVTYVQAGEATYTAVPTTILPQQAVITTPAATAKPVAEAKPAAKTAPKPVETLRAAKADPAVAAPSKPAPAAEVTFSGTTLTLTAPAPDEAAAIRAEIARLQEKLATLKPAGTATTPPLAVAFDKSSSEFEPETLARILTDLGQKKFGNSGKFNLRTGDGKVLVSGDKEVIDWATDLVRRLKGQGP